MKFLNIIMVVCTSCLLLVGGCKSKKDKEDTLHKKRPASPAIKSVKTYLSVSDSAHLKPKETLTQADDYNDKGFKIKHTQYVGDSGAVEYVTTTEVDKNGNAIKTHTIYTAGHVENTETNQYDKDNHKIKTDFTTGDGNYGTHEYKFDKNGKIVQWDWYEKGRLVAKKITLITYDKDDHIVENIDEDIRNGHDTVIEGHETYTYDSATGLQTGSFILYGAAKNIPLEIIEDQYDSLHNKILEIHYERDSMGKLKPNTRVMNVFNEFGEITQSSTFKDGQVQSVTDNVYDNYGHLIEATTKEGGISRKIRYVYEFWK